MMVDDKSGSAVTSVVIEEKLEGDEIRFVGFCEEKTSKPRRTGQGNNRFLGSNTWSNTVGMGRGICTSATL
jgi:phosphoribosylamine-glycine ligase